MGQEKASKPMKGIGVIRQMPTGAGNRQGSHVENFWPAQKSNQSNEIKGIKMTVSWLNAGDIEIRPDDPSTFESKAAHLKRLRLHLLGEQKRLTPDDFGRPLSK